MTGTGALWAYRQLVGLYPRRFRDEYGPDLVQLITDQMRDEPTWRVMSRGAIDLVLTLPARHLEAHMDRSPTPFVTTMFATLALSALVVGAVVGHPLVLLGCLAVAIVAGGFGLLFVHRARPLTRPQLMSARWWQLTTAGTGLLAALIATTTATGELPDGAWLVAMTTGLTAIALIAAGLVLAITHLASRPARRAAAL